jgi:hypothetical protein
MQPVRQDCLRRHVRRAPGLLTSVLDHRLPRRQHRLGNNQPMKRYLTQEASEQARQGS